MQPRNAPPGRSEMQRDSGPELGLRVGMKSAVGPKRKLNEDYAGYRLPDDEGQRLSKGALFVIADGMGGHQAGEVASKEAVVRVIEEYYADTAPSPSESLVRAIRLANRVIHDHALSDPAKSGMGTTLVAAVVLGHKVLVANVGDSRAYLINGQGISQITEDHSWVEEQIRAGLMSREEAAHHPQRNLITRALGAKPSVEVDLFEGQLGEGEFLLLCTDGLSGPLRGQQMASVVRSAEPADAAVRLVAQAASEGGDDNATILIVQVAPPARRQRPEDREQTVISSSPGAAATALARVREQLRRLTATLPQQPYRWLLGALAALTLLFLLAAFAALIWGGDPSPRAAPQPAGVYNEQLLGSGGEEIARSLGYPGFAEMQEAHGGNLDPAAPATQPLWPANWSLYLAGKAGDWQCDGQRCGFTLEMAGEEYQVTYPAGGEQPSLDGSRVVVVGRGEIDSDAVDAEFVARSNRGWAWWGPQREAVYQRQMGQLAWVYGTVDISPNGLVEPGDDSWQERGSPILLLGQWEVPGEETLPIFRYQAVFRMEANRYLLVQGKPEIPLPTSTAKPKPTNDGQ